MERAHNPLLVYGGSFDPVHNGHMAVLWLAAQVLGATEARVLPCFLSPLKSQVFTTPEQRCGLLQRMIDGLNTRSPGCVFTLDRREISVNAPSFTCDTLADLRREQGADRPIIWLLGDDAWRQLPQWRQWQSLTDYAHLLIAQRPGGEDTIEPEQTAWATPRMRAVAHLSLSAHGSIALLNNALLAISARHIRQLLAEGLRPIGLLPDAVEELIYQQGLYLNSCQTDSL